MKAWNEIKHYAGFDWAKDHHDVIVLDAGGKTVAEFRFHHTAGGWDEFSKTLAAFPDAAVAVETNHPDAKLFGSLPGAGDKIAPRLLAEIGDDRALFPDAQGLQCLAGTAPVSYQSGQIHRVYLRRQCNKSLRNVVHLWANLSREFCPWAATYYTALRAKGKSHACALRALGQRWLKIVWKMWQTRTLYDADLHARNQLKHGSWVLQLVNQPAVVKTEKSSGKESPARNP